MEDKEIISLYLQRSDSAIERTAEKYGSLCTAAANNILGDPRDADECVNDTYLRAWNTIPPHIPDILPAYLLKITRNLSFDRFRKKTADKRGGGQTPQVLEELSEIVSGRESVETELDKKELAAEINRWLGGLSKKKRCIFLCRCYFACPITEIAKRCGMSENSVSTALSRMRAELRKYLTERGYEL